MVRQERLTVSSDLGVLSQVQGWFESISYKLQENFDWTYEDVYGLNLAMVEGFTNAVRHAHEQLPTDTAIELEVTLCDNRAEIRIWDRGAPFDPNAIEEPQPGTLRQGGYGWFLLRRLADRVAYERCHDARNCLLIEKYADRNVSPFDPAPQFAATA